MQIPALQNSHITEIPMEQKARILNENINECIIEYYSTDHIMCLTGNIPRDREHISQNIDEYMWLNFTV